jgi:hypothetical protein
METFEEDEGPKGILFKKGLPSPLKEAMSILGSKLSKS